MERGYLFLFISGGSTLFIMLQQPIIDLMFGLNIHGHAISKNINMQMRKFLYIFIVLLLCGCHDDYWELGDSYVYNNGCIYYVIDTCHRDGVRYEGLEELVPFDVHNFGYNEHYIIAYQKPDSEYYIGFNQTIPDSTTRFQEKADSLETLLGKMLSIQNCFWIIRKKDKRVFGPMSESDFNRRCKRMGISLSWVREMK